MVRRRRSRKGGIGSFILTLIIISFIYSGYLSYKENSTEFWINLFGVVISIIIVVVIYKVIKGSIRGIIKAKRLSGLPERVRDIKELLDLFTTDIPKFSKHAEVSYQIDFGRFLKDRLTNDKVSYEVQKEGIRPDIVINDNIAIEIKALKEPNTESNRNYNKSHIESLYKKKDTYIRRFDTVIIIIFNSDLVKDRNWKDYDEMKEILSTSQVILFEK